MRFKKIQIYQCHVGSKSPDGKDSSPSYKVWILDKDKTWWPVEAPPFLGGELYGLPAEVRKVSKGWQLIALITEQGRFAIRKGPILSKKTFTFERVWPSWYSWAVVSTLLLTIVSVVLTIWQIKSIS